MNGVGNAIVRLLGFSSGGEQESVHSVEELEIIVAQSRKAGVLAAEKEVLLRHVFDFSDKTTRDALTPRSDIVALEHDTTVDEAARVMIARSTCITIYWRKKRFSKSLITRLRRATVRRGMVSRTIREKVATTSTSAISATTMLLFLRGAHKTRTQPCPGSVTCRLPRTDESRKYVVISEVISEGHGLR